jgi:hypothetical protein
MSDLQKYIKKRKSRDPKFAENFDSGYEQFKIPLWKDLLMRLAKNFALKSLKNRQGAQMTLRSVGQQKRATRIL